MFEKIFGHNNQIQFFKKSFINKFPQSWIIHGEKGIGKFLLANQMAKWCLLEKYKKINLNKNSINKTVLNKLIVSNIFLMNNRRIDKFGINDIREISKEMHLTSSNEIEKFIIFDDFNETNIQSKNALLKSLEEPKNNNIIIIISHNISILPKTISSRCIKIMLKTLNLNDFKNYYLTKDEKLKEEKLNQIFLLSSGRPGLADFIIDNDWINILKKINIILENKKINFSILYEISTIFEKNPYYVNFLIKSHLYYHSKKILLQNLSNKDIFRGINLYYSSLGKPINFDLNLNLINYLVSLFTTFFKYIKKSS